MKQRVLQFAQCVLTKIIFFSTIIPLHAQVPNPSLWESFVKSDKNILISDTFRLQTFGDSEWDNWEYTTSGSTRIQNVSSINIDKLGGKMGLQMSLQSRINFIKYDPSLYTDVKAEIFFGGLYLNKGDNFRIDIYREKGMSSHTISNINADNATSRYDSLAITNTPCGFDLYTASASSNTKGYYCLQYALAYGKIPSYSLFSGDGNWNDTTHWSHLPPLRHRNALIKGNVNIPTAIYCQNIAIHSGRLNINTNSRLTLNNLDLYGDEAFLYSTGEISLANQITFHKTFEELGKWYFISFPFDVYPSGIDSRFEQKDDTPNNGGNYFYVQTYNGDKRSTTNQSFGNWEVVPIHTDNTPLFEKNKGYLIALDEKATERTLSFSSFPGDIPENFANKGVISISLATDIHPDHSENYGWYLCGNPFPAPLVLSQIDKNPTLDGNIYVYDGSKYKTYSLNSDYALPPFAAFFVKASSTTEVKITSNNIHTKTINIIPTNIPMNKSISEPYFNQQSTKITNPHAANFHFFIKDKVLYLQNIPGNGYINIFNIMGHCILQKKIEQGSQIIPISNLSGTYILQINSSNYHKDYKIALP